MRLLPYRVVLFCAAAIFILTTIICYNNLHDDAIRFDYLLSLNQQLILVGQNLHRQTTCLIIYYAF
jgi:hypothetical protein